MMGNNLPVTFITVAKGATEVNTDKDKLLKIV